MSDDLRTRIAAALLGDYCVQGMTAPCDDCRAHALRQADAVIRELGLISEVGEAFIDHDDGHAGGYPHTHKHHRYVTEWTADE